MYHMCPPEGKVVVMAEVEMAAVAWVAAMAEEATVRVVKAGGARAEEARAEEAREAVETVVAKMGVEAMVEAMVEAVMVEGAMEEEDRVGVVLAGAMAEAMAEEGSEYAVCERAGGAGGDGVGILECFLTNGSHGLDIPFPRTH